MIYTTYFANVRNLPRNVTPIAICGKAPLMWLFPQYKRLAPKIGFFTEWKRNHDNDYYTKCYKKEVLDKLNADSVVRELERIGNYDDIALVCYEAPNDFCHRHLVADWLRENGYEVEEFDGKHSSAD